jgi:hypothetical protein
MSDQKGKSSGTNHRRADSANRRGKKQTGGHKPKKTGGVRYPELGITTERMTFLLRKKELENYLSKFDSNLTIHSVQVSFKAFLDKNLTGDFQIPKSLKIAFREYSSSKHAWEELLQKYSAAQSAVDQTAAIDLESLKTSLIIDWADAGEEEDKINLDKPVDKNTSSKSEV